MRWIAAGAALLASLALAEAVAQGRAGHGAAPDQAFDGLVIERALGGAAETIVVPEGAWVRLVLTTGRAVELHLHGYDLVAEAAPGAPAVLTFHAIHAGRFALVAHGGDDLLGRGEVALAYVEVRPQ